MALQIVNHSTGQVSPVTQETARPLTVHESLILEHESAQDYLDLQANWANDFPGASQAVTFLRQDLCDADWRRRRAQTALHQLELELALTGIPRYCWSRNIQHRIAQRERSFSATQRDFRRTLRALQSAHAPLSSVAGKERVLVAYAELEPPAESKKSRSATFYQTAKKQFIRW
jgi:hypothetical protein